MLWRVLFLLLVRVFLYVGSMNILFVHQNFPGQFKHLAPRLVRDGHRVVALGISPKVGEHWEGVSVLRYAPGRSSTPQIHPWVVDTETKVIRGEAAYAAACRLRHAGFTPDVIVAHPGWGEALFLKDVWPHAKMGLYFEFFYHAEGSDTGFDPEFVSPDPFVKPRMRSKNFNSLLHFDLADAGITPTNWQASTFPISIRHKISVIHDGVDTDKIRPNSAARIRFNSFHGELVELCKGDEVITFVNRNLEPFRGYHQFMRALPIVLRLRPHAQVVIVGGDEVGYGARPDPTRFGARSWKQIFIDEVAGEITEDAWKRVHFLGRVAYEHFVALVQVSAVHVYLTYPFVLSWSLLEAMSAGCAIVASDTAPVKEVITHGENGRLVNFFDNEKLAGEVCDLLENRDERQRMGANARDFVVGSYDLRTICLPAQLNWVDGLAAGA